MKIKTKFLKIFRKFCENYNRSCKNIAKYKNSKESFEESEKYE